MYRFIFFTGKVFLLRLTHLIYTRGVLKEYHNIKLDKYKTSASIKLTLNIIMYESIIVIGNNICRDL